MSERRIRNNKIRRQRQLRRHILISVLTLCLAIAFAFGISSFQANAKASSETIEMKYYTSIIVSYGDSLWTIAEEYMGSHYDCAEDYIDEVIHMNSIASHF